MKFEYFTSEMWRRSDKSAVATLLENCIALNIATAQKCGLKNGQLALIGFNKAENAIGIKLINKPADGARKIRVQSTNAYISCAKFLRRFNIKRRGRFSVDYLCKEKIIVISLNRKFTYENS